MIVGLLYHILQHGLHICQHIICILDGSQTNLIGISGSIVQDLLGLTGSHLDHLISLLICLLHDLMLIDQLLILNICLCNNSLSFLLCICQDRILICQNLLIAFDLLRSLHAKLS